MLLHIRLPTMEKGKATILLTNELTVRSLNLGLNFFIIHRPFRSALRLTILLRYILAWKGLLVLGWERVATVTNSPTAEVGWESPLVWQSHNGPPVARLQMDTLILDVLGSTPPTSELTREKLCRFYNGNR